MTRPDADVTWSMTSTPVDTMVLIGDTWLRTSRIEAVMPSSAYPGKSRVVLSSGQHVYVAGTPQEIVDKLAAARRRISP